MSQTTCGTMLVVVVFAMCSSLAYSLPSAPQYTDTYSHFPKESTQQSSSGDTACKCAMFLVTSSDWLPEHNVFSTGEEYHVNCTDHRLAVDQCKSICEEENSSVGRVFSLHPEALAQYPPSAPCDLLPAPTATFYKTCGSSWQPLMLPTYSHVCCHPFTGLPAWCDAIPNDAYEQPPLQWTAEDRGLDLHLSQHDDENNEIEGSTKPEKYDSVNAGSSPQSWMNSFMRYFGYDNISDMVKGFDIFSLPKRFRKAVKTYRDEVNMGQCYMEYTTYSIFTKGENPFEAFIRTKRDAASIELPEHFYQYQDDEIMEQEYRDSSSDSKQAQIETIKSLVGSMVNMLERTDSTKRYATVIRQLLPVVTKVYAAKDPQEAVNTLVSSVLGPYLEKIHGNKNKPGSDKIANKKDRVKSEPIIADPPPVLLSSSQSSGGGSSPMTSILLNLVRQYMGSYFNTLPGGAEKPSVNAIDTESFPHKPSRPAPMIPGGMMNLLNLFLGGAGSSRPRPRPTQKPTTSVPKPNEKNDNITAAELGQPKDFVDVVLEVIRPVFISILGKAPGDSGVASIREVSRLSVLGRVDDALAQEVLSPYFCIKTYGINKAWSLTERTLRSFVKELSPEEQETVRALFL